MGQLAGARQSGGLMLRFADLARDGEIVRTARQRAVSALQRDPHLTEADHRALRSRLERRYERGMELFRIG